MPSLFGGGQKKGAKQQFEIRLDSPFVVFNGPPSEAEPVDLTGTVFLNNADYMNVASLKIRLEGIRKVSWLTNAINPQQVLDKQVFFRKEERLLAHPSLGSGQTHRIGPGNHEWRFSINMKGDLPESIEGLPSSYIVYELTAVLQKGYITGNMIVKKHIRVIRAMGRDALESIIFEQLNEDIWANKISYKVTVPQINYVYGTSITADFVLTPIRKGVEIEKIRVEVKEGVTLVHSQNGLSEHKDNTVAKVEQPLPPDSAFYNPGAHPEQLTDESYRFQMTLPLPRSLKVCRQTVETDFIKISHLLVLTVELLNPEGHISQLVVRNILKLTISPNLPVGEDNEVQGNATQVAQAAMQLESSGDAPPQYGEHQLDVIYNDIDTNGIMTPRASGPGSGIHTPIYGQHSRSGSAENLAALGATIAGDATAHGGPFAHQLHSRLANVQEHGSSHWARTQAFGSLQNSGGTTPPHVRPTPPNGAVDNYFPNSGSSSRQSHSGRASRRGSGNSPPKEGNGYLNAYDLDALARTPSYNTAVRTPVRTPVGEGLPTYEATISRPTSPELHPPEQAHVRTGHTAAVGASTGVARLSSDLPGLTSRNAQTSSQRPGPVHRRS